jgi:integrase
MGVHTRGRTYWSLLEAAPNYLRPILLLAHDTGIRRSEILNLQWVRLICSTDSSA